MADQPSPETFSGPFILGPDFSTPSLDQWQKAATASLKGRPVETLTAAVDDGVNVKVLYTDGDHSCGSGPPGTYPFTRGGAAASDSRQSWETCTLFDDPDLEVVARQISEETHRGTQSVWVRFSGSVRCGIAPASPAAADWNPDGTIAEDVEDFECLFSGVDPATTPIHLESGGNALATAAAFISAVRRRGIAPDTLCGSFNMDPLSSLLSDGVLVSGLDRSLDLMTPLASWCLENAPFMRALSVSTLPYHSAGATAVQELALALATGIDTLRSLERGGLQPEAACRQLRFIFASGRDFFVEAAKLRAFRRLWAHAASSCGVNGPEAAASIHSVSSSRNLTVRDPWVNLLRVTVGTFAATVGGADSVTTLPFDTLIGPSDPAARRMALNTQTILREESHLDQVIDPGGGSWFIEALTDDLGQAAWTLFQEIEGGGGMRRLIAEDGLTRLLAPATEQAHRNVARRKAPVTGVSTWPQLHESPVTRDQADVEALLDRVASPQSGATSDRDVQTILERLAGEATALNTTPEIMDTAIEAADEGATLSQLAGALQRGSGPSRTIPLPRLRDAAPFEHLRDISDNILVQSGSRPSIFLANLGPIAEHTARATFAKNFFEAGGIQTVSDGGFDTVEAAVQGFKASGAPDACICSSDANYVHGAAPLARALKQAGAKRICLAGRPGDHESHWREAGIDHFIFVGCDVLQTLQILLKAAGVAS